MEKYFVTYEQALDLRKLGFNELCTAWYNDKRKLVYCQLYLLKRNSEIDTKPGTYIGELGCYVPLKSQVFEWFRKEHKLHGNAIIAETNCGFKIQYLSDYINQWFASYESYEEAESACIDKLIEIIKGQ
jgi:hypothetical protein